MFSRRHFVISAFALSAFASGAAHADQLADIKKKGEIVFGVLVTDEPNSFIEPKTRQLVGYEIDLAAAVAKKLGVKPVFKQMAVSARIPELQQGHVDILAATLTHNKEREAQVDFALTHFVTGSKVMVRAAGGVKELGQLAGKKVVVGRGTTGETFLKAAVPDAELVYVDQFAPDGVLQLQQKRVDAAIEDSSLLDYLATQNPTLVTLAGLYSNDPIGIAVAKGDPEFVRWLDMFVSDYIQSGAYEANYKKWWGETANPPELNPTW